MKPAPSSALSAADTQTTAGFPKQKGFTLSHWLQDVQGNPLLDHRTTPELPQSADIAIIGSGMTGTLVAKHCIETWPEKRIVVLEARDFCSGATGRNAGHCKPDQWRGFAEFEAAFGTHQALKILQNEQQTWSDLVAFVRENDVDCDLWVGDTLDVPVTPEVAMAARDQFEHFKAAGGKVDHIQVTHDPAKAVETSRIKDAQACYAWPASTLHPWKLAAHVMRDCLKKGVNLQTHTQVTRVIRSVETPGKWIIQSDRGEIECSLVVHATNAYSAAVEPSLRGLINPTPHMCDQVNPPVAFTGTKSLQNSYGVLLPEGGLFSINPRCTTGGPVLFGGFNPGQREFMKWLEKNPERGTDDGLPGFKSVTEAVREFTQSQFVEWPTASTNEADVYSHRWSGIIASSADGVPFIGQLPGLPGQWVCAGHHGHGMARIFTAAPGLVKLMGGSSWADTQLPEVYQITPSRIRRLKQRTKTESPDLARL